MSHQEKMPTLPDIQKQRAKNYHKGFFDEELMHAVTQYHG